MVFHITHFSCLPPSLGVKWEERTAIRSGLFFFFLIQVHICCPCRLSTAEASWEIAGQRRAQFEAIALSFLFISAAESEGQLCCYVGVKDERGPDKRGEQPDNTTIVGASSKRNRQLLAPKDSWSYNHQKDLTQASESG